MAKGRLRAGQFCSCYRIKTLENGKRTLGKRVVLGTIRTMRLLHPNEEEIEIII